MSERVRNEVAIRSRIRGIVQGVGYRDRVRREAIRRNLSGWVRNLADGSVELLVQGCEEEVEEFLREIARPVGAIRPHSIERCPEPLDSRRLPSFAIES